MRKCRKSVFILIIILILAVSGAIFFRNQNKEAPVTVDKNMQKLVEQSKTEEVHIVAAGSTIEERFLLPEKYERVKMKPNSFEAWLRKYPLKKAGADVHYFDGKIKEYSAHEAVLDLDVGSRDLQQCADSIIRLRAEYLYEIGDYNQIHFNFTNGFNAEYKKWRSGYGISVNENKIEWIKKNYANKSYDSFRKYLNMVFSYSGTLSLEQELKRVDYKDLSIGDVFINGGSPGHCVIIMDVARNNENGKKIFIVAQGFMPAQDMHIVKNLNDSHLSPWYTIDDQNELDFAGMRFQREQLRRFE